MVLIEAEWGECHFLAMTAFFCGLVTLWHTPRGVGLGMLRQDTHAKMKADMLCSLEPLGTVNPFERHEIAILVAWMSF